MPRKIELTLYLDTDDDTIAHDFVQHFIVAGATSVPEATQRAINYGFACAVGQPQPDELPPVTDADLMMAIPSDDPEADGGRISGTSTEESADLLFGEGS